jgi:hypothetical protein
VGYGTLITLKPHLPRAILDNLASLLAFTARGHFFCSLCSESTDGTRTAIMRLDPHGDPSRYPKRVSLLHVSSTPEGAAWFWVAVMK